LATDQQVVVPQVLAFAQELEQVRGQELEQA